MNVFKSISRWPGIWRVDGVGELRIYEKSAPRVKVALSEIKQEGLSASLTSGHSTGEQRIVNVYLNRIDDLLVGSCWKSGHRVNKLSPFEGVQYRIDTRRIQYIRPGDPITLNGRTFPNALPQSAIQLGKNLGHLHHTAYAIVPVLGNKKTDYLIVPCSELYRFYMGVSTRFCNALAKNTLDEYVEWKGPALRMKKSLSVLEQFVAYRGYFDKQGRNWFRAPSDHVKKRAVQNMSLPSDQQLPLIVVAKYPFVGESTLTIAGKRFRYRNSEGDSCWAVFAANIIQCSREVAFEPLIESDIFSTEPSLGFGTDHSDDLPSDHDFEEEDSLDEEDEPPSDRTRGIALLNDSNRFSAMIGMKFKHIHPKNAVDPIYYNAQGQPIEGYSYEECQGGSNANGIGAISEFESQVDRIDRQLTDFIRMILQFRSLVEGYDWSVVTRSCRSMMEVLGEVVTAFLPSNKKRRTWHLVNDGSEGPRHRQVVWAEIDVDEWGFVYLAEMELKESEPGRSTLLIVPKDGCHMPEQDFEVLLNMTAVQNRWPKRTHSWKSDFDQERARKYFEQYHHAFITHLSFIGHDGSLDKDVLPQWARGVEKKIRNELGLSYSDDQAS